MSLNREPKGQDHALPSLRFRTLKHIASACVPIRQPANFGVALGLNDQDRWADGISPGSFPVIQFLVQLLLKRLQRHTALHP